MTSKRLTTEHVEHKAVDRPKRVPLFDQPRNLLTVEGLPNGYIGRWFMDKGDRIEKAKRGGWEIVTYGDLTVGDRTVNTSKNAPKDPVIVPTDGGSAHLYLMSIKKEWYDEDQAAKAEAIDEAERMMLPDDDDDEYSRSSGQVRLVRK